MTDLFQKVPSRQCLTCAQNFSINQQQPEGGRRRGSTYVCFCFSSELSASQGSQRLCSISLDSQPLLPLTCRHLLGASLSHLSDSSPFFSSIRDVTERGRLLLLASVPLAARWGGSCDVGAFWAFFLLFFLNKTFSSE